MNSPMLSKESLAMVAAARTDGDAEGSSRVLVKAGGEWLATRMGQFCSAKKSNHRSPEKHDLYVCTSFRVRH